MSVLYGDPPKHLKLTPTTTTSDVLVKIAWNDASPLRRWSCTTTQQATKDINHAWGIKKL